MFHEAAGGGLGLLGVVNRGVGVNGTERAEGEDAVFHGLDALETPLRVGDDLSELDESRLYRTMTNALKQLKDLQAARHAAAEMEAKARRNFIPWQFESDNFPVPEDPTPEEAINQEPEIGFVFPAGEIPEKSDPQEAAA